MIADKVIPSFYLVELGGAATKAITLKNFGIKTIAISSGNFNSDLEATEALQHSIRSVKELIGKIDLEVKAEFNPEFFPSVDQIELTDDQRELLADAQFQADMSMDEFLKNGNIPVVLNTAFDTNGAFIESRWTVNDAAEKIITGRVAVNPQQYVQLKSAQQLQRHESISKTEKPIRLH